MKSLICASVSVLWKNRGDDNQTRFADLGELEHSATVFPHDDAVDLSPSIIPFPSLYVDIQFRVEDDFIFTYAVYMLIVL